MNGLALIFFESTANSLFLTKYDISNMPYVYVVSAILSIFIGFLYGKVANNLPLIKLSKIIVLFVMSVILTQFLLVEFLSFNPIYFLLMASKDILWMFIGMEFGMIVGAVFNIRQGKRLFGLLALGEIMAGIVGGFSIGIILEYINTVSLLVISGILMIFSFLVLITILKKYKEKFIDDTVNEENQKEQVSYKSLFQERYFVVFFGIAVLIFLTFYFIDFMFYFNLKQQNLSEKELASFFGIFYATINIINLISSVFISGYILRNYGVMFGLLSIPIITTLGTISLLGTLALSISVGFFIIVAIKLINKVLDVSIMAPSFRIIYKSMPEDKRRTIGLFRETVLEPITMGLVGITLIGLNMLESKDIIYWVIVILSITWISLSFVFKKYYLLSLKKITENRRVLTAELNLNEFNDDYFLRKLESTQFIEVIYALEFLKRKQYEDLEKILISMLEHKNKEVKIKVLELIYELNLYDLFLPLKRFIRIEENLDLKAQAIFIYCRLGDVDAIRFVKPFLEEEHFDVIKENAIAGLIKYCGIDGLLLANSYLEALFNSEQSDDKLHALQILNNIKTQGYRKEMRKLLQSRDMSIQIATIRTIGNLKLKKFIPDLVYFLNDINLRKESLLALKGFGIVSFKILKDELLHSKNTRFQHSIIEVMASMKNTFVNNFLLDLINKKSKFIPIVVNELYNNYFYLNDKNMIQVIIKEYNILILELLYNKNQLSKVKYANSIIALEEQIQFMLELNIKILSFIYPREIIIKALIAYKSMDQIKQAYSIELLDNILSKTLRELVIPILENISIELKLIVYKGIKIKKLYSQDDVIKMLLSNDNIDNIVKISLLYEIGKNQDKQFKDDIQYFNHFYDSFFKETSMWTLQQIG